MEWEHALLNAALMDDYAANEQRLRALQRCPQAFGHPVGTVEWIETHISWLLLAGDYAYKFKKPLKLDFLDFSTLALRRAACEEELRINDRTAPDLYLGVVALVGSPAADMRLLPLDEAPSNAEPAVRMRRFDQAALLSQALERQALTPAHIDALARHVAHFHGDAAVALSSQGWGTAQAVRAPVQDCLAALQRIAADAPDLAPLLGPVAKWCEQQGAALAPVFAQRLDAGRVRECHGDLHLANLVLIDGAPQLFDAIEFNPALRWIDCMADIAFLAMDLEARGCADLAWRFLNAWLECTGDYAGLPVLDYYRVYRALVRARVAGLRLAQTTGDARAGCLQEQRRYLELALRFTRPRPVVLWLAHGFSGSGKSTLCRALASAAAARGETVTIFDTDASKSCLKWMQTGKEAGNWSPLVQVIHTLDAHRVAEAIGQIYEQPDQEHLILIDTFGGGSEAQDVLAVAAHRIICPMMLSRGDLSETLETANWYLKLRGRVEKPGELAGISVMLNRVPVRVSETERAVAEELFQSLPALETYLGSRAAYVRMDREGLLGVIADKTPNRALAAHVQSAVKEAGDLLEEIDQLILTPAEIA